MTHRADWNAEAEFNSSPTLTDSQHRYFALVIRVPKAAIGGLVENLHASTDIGNTAREAAPNFLPPGSRITRSIEITQEMATNGIR